MIEFFFRKDSNWEADLRKMAGKAAVELKNPGKTDLISGFLRAIPLKASDGEVIHIRIFTRPQGHIRLLIHPAEWFSDRPQSG